MLDIFNLAQKLHFFKLGQNFLSCVKTIKTLIRFRGIFIHSGINIKNVNHRQIVTLADFKIVKIMRGCNLNRAAAFFRIGIRIGNNRNRAACDRKNNKFSDQILIALVIGMNRNRRITEHRFRTRCGDSDKAFRLAFNRVTDMPHMAFLLPLLDFKIRNGGV